MSDPLAGIGFRILVPKPFKSEAEALFAQAGCNKISINQYELLRNERGLSGEPNELVEEYTPLEVSLHSAIAQNKGCHTGQEVIARQISNDKVSQGLIGLKLTEQVSPGDQVIKDGKKIGKITSVIRSPKHGWIALAVIKRKHIKLGTSVKVESAIDQKEGILVQGRVVKLLFTSP